MTAEPAPAVQRTRRGLTAPPESARFVTNVGSNAMFVVLSTLVMLWYVPYLVQHLGVAAYGFVPLANSLVMFMSIVTEGMTVAVNRNLTLALHRGSAQTADVTYTTALRAVLVMCSVLLPLGLLLVWLAPHAVSIPAGLEPEVRLLFAATLVSFLLGFVRSIFDVPAVATHRFDLYNLGRALTLAVRVGAVVVLFTLTEARLSLVAFAFLASAVVALVFSWRCARHLAPALGRTARRFDREVIRDLTGLGIWSVVNRVGMMLFLGLNLLIVSRFLGAVEAGRYGTLILFPELLRSVIDAVSSVLNPAILTRYASRDTEALSGLALRAVKLIGLLLALPVGLACGFGEIILRLWLGAEFGDLHLLLVLLVGHLSLTLATSPLVYVITAYHRVKIQGIVTLLLGIASVVLALLFGVVLGWGVEGVAAGTALALVAKNVGFLATYTAGVLNRSKFDVLGSLLHALVATVLVATVAVGVNEVLEPTDWFSLMLSAGLITALYAALAWLLALRPDERRLLRRLARGRQS